ncbi:MAG: hypothetical protein ICV81_00615 [Flavisolibacter sp.]|nr:hypothetical protein [Flavisolibacter sp.]
MQRDFNMPGDQENFERGTTYENLPDQTPRREGGDDALSEIAPTDSRADEKVIVNQQREDKTVNIPSQTAPNTSENAGTDDDVVNSS